MEKGKMQNTTGTCAACKQSFAHSELIKHLRHCESRKQSMEDAIKKDKPFKIFHLLIRGKWSPHYFLHLYAAGSAKLTNLDSFVRKIWLECCGHLSRFEIKGQTYSTSPDAEFDDKSMNIHLNAVLHPKLKFRHEYDFGSTTELTIEVLSESQGVLKKKIEMLARNDTPVISCGTCGKPSIEICVECTGKKEEMLCSECIAEHPCDEEMRLPLVNSPRTGVCGYVG